MVVVLSRYGDDGYGQALANALVERGVKVTFGYGFAYRTRKDGESSLRFCDPPFTAVSARGHREVDPEVRYPASAKKLRAAIEKNGHVVQVLRGASGAKWDSANLFVDALFSAVYLKRHMGVKTLTEVIPAFPYVKQDKIFYDDDGQEVEGSPISVNIARTLLQGAGVDNVISVNPHDFRYNTGWVVKNEKTMPNTTKDEYGRICKDGKPILEKEEDWTGFAYAVDAFGKLMEYTLSPDAPMPLKNPILMGGDESMESIVKRYSNNIVVAHKKRNRADDSITGRLELPEDMRDMDALLVDDLCITGGTALMTMEGLANHPKPPRSITFAVVNGVFLRDERLGPGMSTYDKLKAYGKLEAFGDKVNVISTNTVQNPVALVDTVAPIAKELAEVVLK